MHKSEYGGAKGKQRAKMVAKAKEAHKAKAAEKEDKRPAWLKKLKPLKGSK